MNFPTKISFGKFSHESKIKGIMDHMTENIKKIIILGNREEKSEILKICSEWELFFKKKKWETI